MPDKKISDLQLNTTPTGSIEFEVNNSGASERVSLTSMLAGITADYQSADNANAANITALQTDYAQLASPTFIGTVTVPTPAVGGAATNKTYVDAANNLKLSLAGGTMSGAIAMGTSQITGLGDPTASQDAATKIYADSQDLKDCSVLDNYDPTATGIYPTSHTTHTGTIEKGDRYYITVAGTITIAGLVTTFQIGDIIEARIVSAGNVHADWAVIQANVIQATTTISGIAELADGTETAALTDAARVVTPLGLASLTSVDTRPGLIELATQAETDAETDAVRAITPLTLGAKAATDYRKFVGLSNVINYSAGTWTTTRIAAGDYVERKTAAVNTTIIGIDITDEFRTAALRGMKLNSFDIIYRNTTADLTGHSITLSRIAYTDSAIVSITGIPLSLSTLLFTQNANPRVQSTEVSAPAYMVGDKYVIELTVTSALTSVYDFIGFVLRFSRTIN